MIPNITVTKRYPHIRRRAQFYGKTIYGDDAAVLTTDKQLEIRNDGNFPIYFKLITFEDYTYLVGISPIKQNTTVKIQKIPTGPLTALVTKTLIDRTRQEVIKIEEFFSRYYQYYNGGV
jgi:vancomycin resistance protein YoaR